MFTINNPTQDDCPSLDSWTRSAFIVFQKEVGENGTPHYQGYVEFDRPVRLGHVQRCNVRAHWEIRKGSHDQAVQYCTKEDTRIEDPVYLFA